MAFSRAEIAKSMSLNSSTHNPFLDLYDGDVSASASGLTVLPTSPMTTSGVDSADEANDESVIHVVKGDNEANKDVRRGKSVKDASETRTRLPFEPEPEEVELNYNSRPRRAAAPTNMYGIGPPISFGSRKAARSGRPKRKASFTAEDVSESEGEGQLTKARDRLNASKHKRVKRIPVIKSDSEDEDYERASSPEETTKVTRGRQPKKYTSKYTKYVILTALLKQID